MKRFLFWVGICGAAVLLSGCGGSTTLPVVPVPPRLDLLFGYFSSAGGIAAMASACNVGWLADWEMPGLVVTRAEACVAAGVKKLIIGVQGMLFGASGYVGNAAALKPMLDALQAAGLLPYVLAIYPIDEPDKAAGVTDASLTQCCLDVRVLCATYPELADVKLAVIYGSQGRVTPALASFDLAGFDDYDSGAAIFTNGMYDAFVGRLSPSQRAILVPGGASPWQTAPDAFVAKAEDDDRVAMLAPFLWIDYSSPGIGSNGMAAAYLAAGRQVLNLPAV